MPNRRQLLLVGVSLGLVGLLVAIVIIGPSDFFLPEQSTRVDESPESADAEPLKRGSFVGTAGHDVSGTVRLSRDDDGLYLRFENYRQTQGPDVFVYVTPSTTPDSRAEIAAGTRIPIDGGADGGESTKEGTFSQRLPDDVDPGSIEGVGIWCDQFATPFGYATLDPVEA